MAAALVSDEAQPCLTGFDVLDSLERGLLNHPLIDSEEQRRRYADLVGQVREELEDTVKAEVRSAVAADVPGRA